MLTQLRLSSCYAWSPGTTSLKHKSSDLFNWFYPDLSRLSFLRCLQQPEGSCQAFLMASLQAFSFTVPSTWTPTHLLPQQSLFLELKVSPPPPDFSAAKPNKVQIYIHSHPHCQHHCLISISNVIEHLLSAYGQMLNQPLMTPHDPFSQLVRNCTKMTSTASFPRQFLKVYLTQCQLNTHKWPANSNHK